MENTYSSMGADMCFYIERRLDELGYISPKAKSSKDNLAFLVVLYRMLLKG